MAEGEPERQSVIRLSELGRVGDKRKMRSGHTMIKNTTATLVVSSCPIFSEKLRVSHRTEPDLPD